MRVRILAVLAMVVVLCGMTTSPEASSLVKKGYAVSDTMYYFGHVLSGPFKVDTANGKVFLVDKAGTRYAFKVSKPAELKPVATKSKVVAEQMPDALDEVKNLDRDALDTYVRIEAQKAYEAGTSKEDVLVFAKSTYMKRRDLITSVEIRSDGSLLRYYPGWRMPVVLKLDLNPANTVSPDLWTQGDVTDLQNALNTGATVVIGWSGQYQIIPKYRLREFNDEFRAIKEGRTIKNGQLNREELIEPIRNPRSLTDLKALGEKE